jgi:hypothetical protein
MINSLKGALITIGIRLFYTNALVEGETGSAVFPEYGLTAFDYLEVRE